MGDGLEDLKDLKIEKYPQPVKLRNPPMNQLFRKSPSSNRKSKKCLNLNRLAICHSMKLKCNNNTHLIELSTMN